MLVNTKCSCNEYLYSDELIVLLLPCNHYLHEKCLNNHLIDNQKNCLICGMKIEKMMSEEKIKKSKNKKHMIDLRSLKYKSSDLILDYTKYPSFILKFNLLWNKLISSKKQNDFVIFLELFLKMTNMKINLIDNTKKNKIIYKNNKIFWKNEKDEKCKKIIISNHCCLIDSFVLYYLFQCGFISSDTINKLDVGKIVAEKCDLLIFKRSDKSTGMVEKIKKYLNEKKKIVIFPQGAISYGRTLSTFRTGAFHASDTICPVTIKFTPEVNEPNIYDYYFKILTQDNIKVDVTINDFEFGPFDTNKIETIRKNMAKQLNFDLSNISTKGLKD